MLLEGRVIGLVEDDPVMGESLVQSLSLEGCHVDWWKTGQDALRGLRATSPDLVVCDIKLPDLRGDDLFRQLAATSSVPPFLFVTAFGDIDQAVAIMRAGASDYVTKPFDIGSFIERARALIQRNPVARQDAVLGVSDEMRDVERALHRISDLTSPLLITGETGTGKEVCARYLASDIGALEGALHCRQLCRHPAGRHGEGVVRLQRGGNPRISSRLRRAYEKWCAVPR